MDWDKLRLFHAVAGTGSLTAASKILGMSQSAVSRNISALEDSLGHPLFVRHARGLSLTEQGELLYKAASDVAATLSRTRSKLDDCVQNPSGVLRVICPVSLGSSWLSPKLADFRRAYPEIEIRLDLTDDDVNYNIIEPDVILSSVRPQQLDHVCRKLFTVDYKLYAAKTYIAQRGFPGSPCDLDDHDVLMYGASSIKPAKGVNWAALAARPEDNPRDPALRANSIYALYLAAASGAGIVGLPAYLGDSDVRLTRVLPKEKTPGVDIFMIYPENMRHSKRHSVFREFLVAISGEWNDKTSEQNAQSNAVSA
ncbi:MAG: LysR family transcriptional regulator [Pseudomonadota bacterium]